MASNLSACLTTIILGLMILTLLPPSGGVPLEELDRALSVLRYRGRALFANAIATSDLLFDLLSADSLTLLGPTDSMLFAVDVTHSLPFYIATLRLHALPLRLPLSALRSLPNASSLPTLLPSHPLLLSRPSSSPPDSILLNGVPLLLPGLFYSRHVAVHGLAALLPFSASLSAPSNPENPHKARHQTVVSPIADSRSAASSQAPELKPAILPPSPDAYTASVVPAAGPSRFDGSTEVAKASPDSSPERALPRGDLNPPKVGEVSLLQLAFLAAKKVGEEDKALLDMETSEF